MVASEPCCAFAAFRPVMSDLWLSGSSEDLRPSWKPAAFSDLRYGWLARAIPSSGARHNRMNCEASEFVFVFGHSRVSCEEAVGTVVDKPDTPLAPLTFWLTKVVVVVGSWLTALLTALLTFDVETNA